MNNRPTVGELLRGDEVEIKKDEPRRGKPYVWVTWIVGLLAGSSRCEWAAWYRAHVKVNEVVESDFDMQAWTAEHDALVTKRANELRAEGWTVNVEDDNKFQLKGTLANLGGKADLFQTRGAVVRVRDIKTGKERESDHWQVRVYLYAYGKVAPNLRARDLAGILDYKGREVSVALPTVVEIAKIGTVMQMAGGDLEPPRTPSPGECGRCNIKACTERDSSGPMQAESGDF